MHLITQALRSMVYASCLMGSSLAVWADSVSASDEGVRFSCEPERLNDVSAGMASYLSTLGIAPDLLVIRQDQAQGTLLYTLNTPSDDFDTLRFSRDPRFKIRDQTLRLPAKGGKVRSVRTVSQKEILLALFQHGRLTEFSGENCNIEALKDMVGLRQNIVAWSENLNWIWPNGGPARWNDKYWHRGTPLPDVPLHAALEDAFNHQGQYAIGCYTAIKLVMVQGVTDYYRRVKNDLSREKQVEARLTVDQEPLVDIEPPKMWSFEQDFDPGELSHPGKILQIQYQIAPRNFVPGDWAYLLNNDPVSVQKTGYEGSNAVYLGRNKFVDFYNDNNHAYSYWQKLDEVFQWRNGVFSRSRDHAKIEPLSKEGIEQLGRPPAEGGLVMDLRVFPMLLPSN